MNCPNCVKKPVGFMGTFYLKGVGFKRALQGFFRCQHCDTILIQKKNDSGFPQFEKPFWLIYPLFILGLLGITWGVFYYLESTISSEQVWFAIPAIIALFALLFVIMDRIRGRYWVLKETTFEKHEDELKSQKLSSMSVIAFLFFGVLAITSFLFLDDFAETIDLTPTVYTLSAIVYMMLVVAMAFGLMKYLSNGNSAQKE